jgi:hypothetical protein
MQDTRLNRLVLTLSQRLVGWLQNPWRRLSVLIISLLFGNFLGPAIATVAGQQARLDIVLAAVMVAGVEFVSGLFYRRGNNSPRRTLALDLLNGIKLGVIYSLFVEAFKLAS